MARLTKLDDWVNSFECNIYRLKLWIPGCEKSMELKRQYNIYFEGYFYEVYEELCIIPNNLKKAMRCAKSLKDVKDASPVPLEEIIDKCKIGKELYHKGDRLGNSTGTLKHFSEFVDVANEVLALILKLFENLAEKYLGYKGYIEDWEEDLNRRKKEAELCKDADERWATITTHNTK